METIKGWVKEKPIYAVILAAILVSVVYNLYW